MNDQRLDEETLTSSLKALGEEMASLNAPPEIELRLREAFRAQQVVAPIRRRRASYWLAAVAAMILIVIGVIALRSRPEPAKPFTAQEKQQPQINEQRNVEAPKIQEAEPAPEPHKQIAQNQVRPAKRRVPNREVANHVNREIATDFMSLGYVNPTTFQDGGQIVRIELPRSALVSFGLPVNMERYHEKVKADVLLGSDGLAHAIRFVQ